MKTKSFIRNVFYVSCLVVFFLHFVLTVLYVLPTNPLRTVTTLPERYIGKFFPQEWAFFSPNPVNSDFGLSADCIDSETKKRSGLLDVISGLWKAHQANRISPYDRIQRVPTNYVYQRIGYDPNDFKLASYCKGKDSLLGCQDLKERYEFQTKDSTRNLVRVVSAFCADMGKEYDKARIVVWETKVPRWSKRYKAQKSVQVIEEIGPLRLKPSKAFGIWTAL